MRTELPPTRRLPRSAAQAPVPDRCGRRRMRAAGHRARDDSRVGELPVCCASSWLSALLHAAVSRTGCVPTSIREMSAPAALDRAVSGLRGHVRSDPVCSVLAAMQASIRRAQGPGVLRVALRRPRASAGSPISISWSRRGISPPHSVLAPLGYQLPAGMSVNTAAGDIRRPGALAAGRAGALSA